MTLTKKEQLYEDIIMAGFGGQGLMFIGKLLAYSAMKEGKHVTWIPSYGPEMRGGTANCTVVISDAEIGSPATLHPHSVIVMNNPSLEAFEQRVRKGGLLLISSSMVNRPVTRQDIEAVAIPATELALAAGSEKAANMAMLGAYIALSKIVEETSIVEGLRELFQEKMELFEANTRAFKEGLTYASQHKGKVKA